MKDELQALLCDYLPGNDANGIDEILDRWSVAEVDQAVCEILRTANGENIVYALWFVRDAYLMPHGRQKEFRRTIKSSEFWGELGALLVASNYTIRHNVIYTIGKLTCPEWRHLLENVFPWYIANDPINLPGLIFEIRWLSEGVAWPFFDAASAADNYLARWSLCELIDNPENEERREKYVRYLSALKADLNPLPVAEASYLLKRVMTNAGSKLTKAEWRKEGKRIARLEPEHTFSRVANRFRNTWGETKTDYSVAEFEEFVRGLV